VAGNDLLAGLLAYSWKGVFFPTTTFRVSLRHDLARHEYPERDGAHIEPTGRAPLEFSAHIPFLNNIQLGANEAGVIHPIYPNAYRAFLDVAVDRAPGDMVHPELGTIRCTLERCETTWTAERNRDGVMVDVSWLEATDKPSDLANLLAQPSPAQQLAESARDADDAMNAALAALKSKNAKVDKDMRALLDNYINQDGAISFSELARRLTAVPDQIDLLQKRTTGVLDSITFRAQNLQNSMDRAGAASAYWPIRQAAERMKSAAAAVKQTLVSKQRSVGLYVLAYDTTLSSVAQDIPAKLGDVILLNPQLASAPFVAKGTTVRYYLSAA
jgi:prophage DNA circulation protein